MYNITLQTFVVKINIEKSLYICKTEKHVRLSDGSKLSLEINITFQIKSKRTVTSVELRMSLEKDDLAVFHKASQGTICLGEVVKVQGMIINFAISET
jgi:hypothetical protein